MSPLSIPMRLTRSAPTLKSGSRYARSAATASQSSLWERMRGHRTRQSSMDLATSSSLGIL